MSGPSGGGAERKKSVAPSGKKLSMLAQYDELTRMAMALCKGDEEEFINILDRQEGARKLWVSSLMHNFLFGALMHETKGRCREVPTSVSQ